MTVWIPIAKFFRIKSPQNRTERCCSRPLNSTRPSFNKQAAAFAFPPNLTIFCSLRKGGIRPSARLDVKPALALARANGFIGNKKVSYHPIFIQLFFNETTVNYSFLTACSWLPVCFYLLRKLFETPFLHVAAPSVTAISMASRIWNLNGNLLSHRLTATSSAFASYIYLPQVVEHEVGFPVMNEQRPFKIFYLPANNDSSLFFIRNN